MTDDDIKRITQEVGFVGYGEDMGEYHIPVPAFRGRLAWFARKVAKLERDACLILCLETFEDGYGRPDDAERIASKIAARDTAEDITRIAIEAGFDCDNDVGDKRKGA